MHQGRIQTQNLTDALYRQALQARNLARGIPRHAGIL